MPRWRTITNNTTRHLGKKYYRQLAESAHNLTRSIRELQKRRREVRESIDAAELAFMSIAPGDLAQMMELATRIESGRNTLFELEAEIDNLEARLASEDYQFRNVSVMIGGREERPSMDPAEETPLWPLGQPQGRSRTMLPLLFGSVSVDTLPDSGSDENIMSSAFVDKLNLVIDTDDVHKKEFRIANNKTVTALGRVQTVCRFARDRGIEVLSDFYVFAETACDVIMGMAFLDSTATLLKANKHRLKRKAVPHFQVHRVAAVDNPRRRLQCFIDNESMLANADTGAEMNLVSLQYAKGRGLELQSVPSHESEVELADGSRESIIGKVRMEVKIGSRLQDAVSRMVDFHVLPNLSCAILLGADLLEQEDVFETYRLRTMVEFGISRLYEACTILWANTVEKYISKSRNITLKPVTDDLNSNDDTTQGSPPVRSPIQWARNLFKRPKNANCDSERGAGHDEGQADLVLETLDASRLAESNAREIHRRQRARLKIDQMPQGPLRDAAEQAELTAVAEFDRSRGRGPQPAQQ